ncbi:MAG TPA: hypothetical protein ENG40_03670, partial [Thermoprotei archaeon]|nr:hypothetical protein [Thermoprotei archaeon]
MKEFLRNKRTILTIFILVLIFISSLIVSIQFLTPKNYRIGVITFLKEIMSQRDAEKYLSQIYYVYRSNDIKGIILYIDCPGGAASPIEAIYYALKTLGKEKPIVAYVGGLAASGGYYIAVSAEYIIVSPSSILGNVGLISTPPPIIVPTEEIFETGPYKLIGFSPISFPFNMSGFLDKFVENVYKGRGDRLKLAREELILGKVYFGYEAVRLGLADQVGSIIDAIKYIENKTGLKNYDVVFIENGEKFSESFIPKGNYSRLSYETLLKNFSRPEIYYLYIKDSIPNMDDEELYRPSKDIAINTCGEKSIVIDFTHRNLLSILQLNTIASIAVEMNCSINIISDFDKMSSSLMKASLVIIPTPVKEYSEKEVKIYIEFVKRGGKIMFLFDPAYYYAYIMNTISSKFGIVFVEGYLYDMHRNYGYYRNIYVHYNGSKFNITNIILFTSATIVSNRNSHEFTTYNTTYQSVREIRGIYTPIIIDKNIVGIA